MSNTVQFQEKLNQLLDMCKVCENEVEKEEVEKFFEEEAFSDEQMRLVYDYLLSQKILVKGYLKEMEAAEEIQEKFTQEEVDFLSKYQEELQMLPQTDPMSRLLSQVVEMAKTLYHKEIFIGDLIQEGSLGILLLMNEEANEERLLQAARESMQAFIESQTEVRIQDQKMADKVNELDDKIKKMTEEMGRKVSVEELAQLLEIAEEEIEDIVRLAGEDLEETDEK